MIEFDSLPEVSAIYRVWHQGQVVYVGKTENLKQRWKNHHIFPKLIQAYGADWTIDWVEVPKKHLNRAEAFAYRHFKPVLNQINPCTQLGRSNASTNEHEPMSETVLESSKIY